MNTNDKIESLLEQMVRASQAESTARLMQPQQPRGIPQWFIPIIGVIATASVALLAWILSQNVTLGQNIIEIRGEVATYQASNNGQYTSLKEKMENVVDTIKELRSKNVTENGGVQRLENRISGVEEAVNKLDNRVNDISRDQTDMLELMKGK